MYVKRITLKDANCFSLIRLCAQVKCCLSATARKFTAVHARGRSKRRVILRAKHISGIAVQRTMQKKIESQEVGSDEE